MKTTKPSKLRQKEDAILVRDALHANKGAPYSPAFNPHLPPLARSPWPIRAERFERHYTKWRNGWIRADAHFREVCESYGVTPTK